MRCVACGAVPGQSCNTRTHVVHDRLWSEVYTPPTESVSKRKSPERPTRATHDEPMISMGDSWVCRAYAGYRPGTFNQTQAGAPRVDGLVPGAGS